MSFTVLPVVFPADLAGQENGKIDPSLMVSVGPGGTVGLLHRNAARGYRAMCAAARIAGFHLAYSGCYRTFVQQYTVFTARYIPEEQWITRRAEIAWTGAYPSQVKTYAGKRWAKKIGVATAAVPGTSNHGLGLAIDLGLDSDPSDDFNDYNENVALNAAANVWLQANVVRFGFSYETVPEEPWHVRWVVGDRIPAAVIAYEQSLLPPLPPPQPPTNPPTIEVDDEEDSVFLRTPDGVIIEIAARQCSHVRSGGYAGTRPIVGVDFAAVANYLSTESTHRTIGACPPEWVGNSIMQPLWEAARGAH